MKSISSGDAVAPALYAPVTLGAIPAPLSWGAGIFFFFFFLRDEDGTVGEVKDFLDPFTMRFFITVFGVDETESFRSNNLPRDVPAFTSSSFK